MASESLIKVPTIAPVVRRWKSLRRRTRLDLVAVAVAVAVAIGGWSIFGLWPDPWPARVSFDVPSNNFAVASSPDGRTMLVAGYGGLIPWDVPTGQQGIPWASEHGLSVRKGVYSPDGKTFAAANSDHPSSGTIELIDTSTGRSRASLSLENPIVHNVAFTDDGRTLRAFLGDGTNLKEAATWDVATARSTSSRPLTPPTRLTATAFSSDGRWLALVFWNCPTVQLWDLEADRAIATLTNPAAKGYLDCGMSFSPDGRTLAVGREGDGEVDLWDVPGRKFLKTDSVHPRDYSSQFIQFAPDGRTFASAATENGNRSALARTYINLKWKLFGSYTPPASELVVVDVATGRRIVRSSSHFELYAPDGRSIFTREIGNSIKLRNLPSPSK